MKLFVVGSGKLASALLSSDLRFPSCNVIPWGSEHETEKEKALVVHAGSGRQLKECIAFCERTDSVLIELSTGLETETLASSFTLIVCPNTSILMLKVLNLLKHNGHYFEHDSVSITESHQASKTSVPGTAFRFAESLKVPVKNIISVRDPEAQCNDIGIPQEYLPKHAFHRIVIKDEMDEVTLETKVLGHNSYVKGVKKIIEAVLSHDFEKRNYSVMELIDKKWL